MGLRPQYASLFTLLITSRGKSVCICSEWLHSMAGTKGCCYAPDCLPLLSENSASLAYLCGDNGAHFQVSQRHSQCCIWLQTHEKFKLKCACFNSSAHMQQQTESSGHDCRIVCFGKLQKLMEAFPSIPLFDWRFGTLLEFGIKLPTLQVMEPALPSETTVNF